MKVVVAILYSALISCSGGEHYFCQTQVENGEYCLIESVEVSNYNPACKMYFPDYAFIKLEYPVIDYLSPLLMYRMAGLEELYIFSGRVVIAYVKPTLYYLHILNSELKELQIDTSEEYRLLELHLSQNGLENMPANLNHLKNLTLLDLSNNYLQHIDMGQLDNLQHLKTLMLNNNQIKVVFATRNAELIALQDLYLERNSIAALDISRWETPALKELRISNNLLRHVDHFPEKFPELSIMQLEENRWDCVWHGGVTTKLNAANKTQLSTNFTMLECTAPKEIIPAGAKKEEEFKKSMKATIVQFIGKTAKTDIELDEMVEDMFCKVNSM